MKKYISLFWFRNDLRLTDNKPLYESIKNGNVIAIYIFDKNSKIGSASKLWLEKSLNSLNNDLNNKLNIFNGEPLEIIKSLTKKYNIDNVYWGYCYDKYSIDRDTKIKTFLKLQNINVKSCNSSLLIEPWKCLKKDNTHYNVYTAFYKNLIATRKQKPTLPKVKITNFIKINDSIDIKKLNLSNPKHQWQNIINSCQIGEKFALQKFDKFIKNNIENYKSYRDIPSLKSTSFLSEHLHFGEISPNQIFNSINNTNENTQTFIKELIWRDFAYYTMFYYKDIDTKNINPKFDSFKWENNLHLLEKWQKGQTGIPIIDAGMRELWQTGYMHNRVRMIVASFLTKNCLVHWKYGEKWFFDCLFDADIASNNFNWQWVAGCGLDASPYFRIFNPITQAKKFDVNGNYIRKYVPELALLSDKWITEPFNAKKEILKSANIELGKNYPFPIVDLSETRKKALSIFKELSK